jgi:CRISPR/Cas system CSM-associated protein Csm3 (group 7 of RAMP superfamily)
MEKFKFALLMMCFFVCFACKKQEDPAAKEIIIQDVFITDVNAERINITYKLSDLGYKETGITFYKKDNPAEQRTVLSIRKNDQFMVSMQNLEPGTEYGFKVYYTMENLEKSSIRNILLKLFPRLR